MRPRFGAALQSVLEQGELRREQRWITSKLWNDCHAPDQVRPALERTLADLRLQYLDLYLIHWPVAHRHGVRMPSAAADQIPLELLPLHVTWAAMEELVDAGLVRRIGLSNCSAAKLAALLPHCRHWPAVNQVERHPWLQQNELLGFCRNQDIAVTAYAPLGSPASGWRPISRPANCSSVQARWRRSAVSTATIASWTAASGSCPVGPTAAPASGMNSPPREPHQGTMRTGVPTAVRSNSQRAVARLRRMHPRLRGTPKHWPASSCQGAGCRQ